MDTEKVDEIEKNPDVAVCVQSSTQFASLSGKAVVSNDRERIHKLYNSAWKLWFPEGPDQPDIRLIEFTPSVGEYWDVSGTTGLSFMWEAGKALVSGDAMHESKNDLDQHAQTSL